MKEKASVIVRFAASFIDILILIIPLMIASMIPFIGTLVVQWGYFITLTYKWEGQTVGKRLFGIKVGDASGKTPELMSIVLRETIGKFISGLVLGLGYLWAIFDKDKQAWHDKIGKTYVYQVTPLTSTKKALAWGIFGLALLLIIGTILMALTGAFVASQFITNPTIQQELQNQPQEVQQKIEDQTPALNLEDTKLPSNQE